MISNNFETFDGPIGYHLTSHFSRKGVGLMLAIRCLLAAVVFEFCCPWLTAAEPVIQPVIQPGAARELTARDLASSRMAILIEVDRPLQLVDNPLGRDVWELLRQSSGAQKGLASPDVDRFRQVAKFIEKSLSVDWRTGIARLTAGGIVVIVEPNMPPAEPAVTVVVTTADEQTLKRFIDAVQVEIRRTAQETAPDKLAARKVSEAETTSYRSFVIHRVGNGYFSPVGRQLVASNTKDQLQVSLDGLAAPAAEPAFALPASLRLTDANGHAPAIMATVNLKMAREEPKTRSSLELPANELLPPFLLGGYLDLFRRADFASAGLFVDGPAHEVKIRFPVGTAGAYKGLRGFFASESNESAPPLLQPPGTIFTAGWYRDYQKLWDNRGELVNSGLVQQIDAASMRAQTEGLGFSMADVARWIGPRFRFVVGRQREAVYQTKLDERLPAAALIVELRDETAVRERILSPADGLLLVGLRMLGKQVEGYKKADYRHARLTLFRFAEKADTADGGKPPSGKPPSGKPPSGKTSLGNTGPGKAGAGTAILYNFNPAYAFARGHLVFGSTAEIVRDVIDELERQAQTGSANSSASEPGEPVSGRATDRQQLSLTELSEFLKGYQDRFERDAVQGQGMSPAVAAREFELIHLVLKRLGHLTTTSTIAPDHFDLNIRLGGGIE